MGPLLSPLCSCPGVHLLLYPPPPAGGLRCKRITLWFSRSNERGTRWAQVSWGSVQAKVALRPCDLKNIRKQMRTRTPTWPKHALRHARHEVVLSETLCCQTQRSSGAAGSWAHDLTSAGVPGTGSPASVVELGAWSNGSDGSNGSTCVAANSVIRRCCALGITGCSAAGAPLRVRLTEGSHCRNHRGRKPRCPQAASGQLRAAAAFPGPLPGTGGSGPCGSACRRVRARCPRCPRCSASLSQNRTGRRMH